MAFLSWLDILQPHFSYPKIKNLCSLNLFKISWPKVSSTKHSICENKNLTTTETNRLPKIVDQRAYLNPEYSNRKLFRDKTMITKIEQPKYTLKHYLIQRAFLSFDEFPSSTRFFSSTRTMARNPFSGGPVEMGIRKKLTEKLKPIHLEVINESYKHNTPPQAESHFKMLVVSELFRDMPLVKRHQAINSLLTEELKKSVHAISIDAKTPEQWTDKPEIVPTPNCLGGFGR